MAHLDRAMANLRKRYEELRPYLVEAKAIQDALTSLEQVARAQIASGSARPAVADLAEVVIAEQGGKMAAGDLLRALHAKGSDVSQPVLASAIRRDRRFAIPERGIYELRDAGPGEAIPRGPKRRKSRSGTSSTAIEVLGDLPAEFTRIDLAAKLLERIPDANTEAHTMRALLHYLVKGNYIGVVKEGSAASPTVYRAKVARADGDASK